MLMAKLRRSRLSADRGQTIFLMPIAFLIVILMGSVTIEAGNLHLRQRQLDDLADSLASDAATVGFDVDLFRADGTIAIDQDIAATVIGEGIQFSNLPTATSSSISTPEIDEIEIELTYVHDFILGKQVFGLSQTLTATGNASLIPSNATGP